MPPFEKGQSGNPKGRPKVKQGETVKDLHVKIDNNHRELMHLFEKFAANFSIRRIGSLWVDENEFNDRLHRMRNIIDQLRLKYSDYEITIELGTHVIARGDFQYKLDIGLVNAEQYADLLECGIQYADKLYKRKIEEINNGR